MITIKGTEAEIDYLIECMVDNCGGCPGRKKCIQETAHKCRGCTDREICGLAGGECIAEEKSCGEMIRESINIIVEE